MAFDTKYACISSLPPPDFGQDEESHYIAELEGKWGVKFDEFESKVHKLIKRGNFLPSVFHLLLPLPLRHGL